MPEIPRHLSKKTRPLPRVPEEVFEDGEATEYRLSHRPGNVGRVAPEGTGYKVKELSNPEMGLPEFPKGPVITVTRVSASGGAVTGIEVAQPGKVSKSKRRRLRRQRAKLKRTGGKIQ